MFAQILAFFAFLQTFGSSADQVNHLPLNRFGFVRSHDAATGYLVDNGYKSEIINKWTRTQTENITTQLNCGMRAIDWRPILVNNTVYMHHGQVTVPIRQADMIKEVVAWAAASEKFAGEAYEQLVLINVWDCWNTGCDDNALAEFEDAGISVISIAELASLTVGGALNKSSLAGGGHVLAVKGDVGVSGWVTYDQYLECHGFLNRTDEIAWGDKVSTCLKKPLNEIQISIDFDRLVACIVSLEGILMKAEHYNCWRDSDTHAYAYGQLLDFIFQTTSKEPPSTGELWEIQGAWAEDVADIALGFFLNADMIKDEVESKLNKALVTAIKNETTIVHHPPMVGVNNVCDGGEELRQALLVRVRNLANKL